MLLDGGMAMADCIKDWTGNYNSIYKIIGASSHTDKKREEHDYYATEPKALEKLLKVETFNHYIWECACGAGHLSKVLKQNGFDVRSSDLIDRGYEETEILDFLKISNADTKGGFSRDIITNPPYKFAKEFVEKALEISLETVKIAMLLKLTFLEGQERLKFFRKYPPKKIYVFSSRIKCAKNGDFLQRDENGNPIKAYGSATLIVN